MILTVDGHDYPTQTVRVARFPKDFATLFPAPPGLIEDTWPPTQITYLGVYLKALKCKTIVVESRYLDRDYVNDMALFYSRSLRSYPNFCQRIHFFKEAFTTPRWKEMATAATDRANHKKFLEKSYLGFCVIKPLPGSPVGRTVLATFGTDAPGGLKRTFGAVRRYNVHLGGYELAIKGLAFQQQDQGVSACATSALW